MDHLKKKRGENWCSEEKEILRQLISESAHIIESKCIKTNTNVMKAKEWKNIKNKFNEITGKSRTESEVKLAWKRMKLAAKENLSQHRQQQLHTGGGEKPPSPSQEDQAIMAIAPYDFVIEMNNYDSDAVQISQNPLKQDDSIGESSCSVKPTNTVLSDVPDALSEDIVEKVVSITAENTQIKKTQKGMKNCKDTMTDKIVGSNILYKKKTLEMLEVEHAYNVKIAKLKLKKLELEIELLESKKNIKQQ